MQVSQDIIDVIGGLDMIDDVLSGKIILRDAPRSFPVWRKFTTKLTHLEDFERETAEDRHFNVSSEAKAIFTGPHCETAIEKGVEVNLAKVSVADLGFSEGGSLSEILRYVKECGMALCHWSFALDARVLYDEKHGPTLMLMEPMIISGRPSELRSMFKLTCSAASGSLWIDVHEYGLNVGHVLKPEIELIMVVPHHLSNLPKKKAHH